MNLGELMILNLLMLISLALISRAIYQRRIVCSTILLTLKY